MNDIRLSVKGKGEEGRENKMMLGPTVEWTQKGK